MLGEHTEEPILDINTGDIFQLRSLKCGKQKQTWAGGILSLYEASAQQRRQMIRIRKASYRMGTAPQTPHLTED